MNLTTRTASQPASQPARKLPPAAVGGMRCRRHMHCFGICGIGIMSYPGRLTSRQFGSWLVMVWLLAFIEELQYHEMVQPDNHRLWVQNRCLSGCTLYSAPAKSQCTYREPEALLEFFGLFGVVLWTANQHRFSSS